jgi:hypothetical protein
MPIVARGEAETPRNYSAAVERDPVAHPIQRASLVIPIGVFRTAGELYRYCVCSYDDEGRALEDEEGVDEVAWVIFDNVYMRRSGVFPTNADRTKGRAARFSPGGGLRSRLMAVEFWRGAIEQWGLPGSTMVSSAGTHAGRSVQTAERTPESLAGPDLTDQASTVRDQVEDCQPSDACDPVVHDPSRFAWIDRMFASSRYLEQKRVSTGRGLPSDAEVRCLVGALLDRGGKMTRLGLAQRLGLSFARLNGLVAATRRVLNVDGLAVLEVDDPSDTVCLNQALLEQQFGLMR